MAHRQSPTAHFRRVFRELSAAVDQGQSLKPHHHHNGTSSNNSTGFSQTTVQGTNQNPDYLYQLSANQLDLALLVGLSLFFFFAAPSISSWIANGKYTRGWCLIGSDKKRKKDGFIEFESMGVLRRVGSLDTRPPPKVRMVGAVVANWSYWSNKLLLRNVPYLSLTMGQILVALSYEGLVVLFFRLHLPGDVASNFKLPAHIALAQLPAIVMLAAKNSLINIVGKSYERVNFLHRVAGRCLFVCAAIHVFFYYNGSHRHKNTDYSQPVIYTGVTAFSSLCLIVATSIPLLRRAFYQIFICCHVIGWLTFAVAVSYHAPDVARPYTFGAFGVYLIDWLCRIALTRYRPATLMSLQGGMTMIQVHGISGGWRAGQHVYVRVLNGRKRFENHPFTVANAPASASPLNGQHCLTLLAKSTGDWTRALQQVAETKVSMVGDTEKKAFGYGRTTNVIVEGPYGGTGFTDLSESQAVLLVAGGSGITFCAAILEEILGQAVEGTCRTRVITLVWSIKSICCVDWYQDFFNQLLAIARTRTNVTVRLRIHLTGPNRADFVPVQGAGVFPNRMDLSALLTEVCDDVLESVVVKGCERGGGVALGICGPIPLVREARSAVAGVSRARAVKVGGIIAHSEGFGY